MLFGRRVLGDLLLSVRLRRSGLSWTARSVKLLIADACQRKKRDMSWAKARGPVREPDATSATSTQICTIPVYYLTVFTAQVSYIFPTTLVRHHLWESKPDSGKWQKHSEDRRS